jgi:hypothetical protein
MKTATAKEKQTETKPGITEESASDLADFISATLRHPDCPKELYEAIGQEICEMSNDMQTREYCESSEYIKQCLLASVGKSEDGETDETEAEETETEATESAPQMRREKVQIPDEIVYEIYDIAENAPRYVKRELLNYLFEKTGIAVEEKDEIEIETSHLAEAISYVLKCEDTPEILRHHLGCITLSDIQSLIDYDTPEMIERGLQAYQESGENEALKQREAEAIKRDREIAAKLFGSDESNKAEPQKQRISPDTQLLVINPQYDELKKIVESFFTLDILQDLEETHEMANKFICLFAEFERLRQAVPAYYDSFELLQEFCFTFTTDFEDAVDSYKAKLNCPVQESDEPKETDETEETAGSC